jgi:hypothetical protein
VRRRHVLLSIAACLFSCDRDERIVAGGYALTKPTLLCHDAAAIPRSCRKPDDVEALLQREDLEILAAGKTATGVQGARILTLRSGGPHPVVFRAKWRPDSSATSRNNPRLELGAYAVQKLFLEPYEYVVPPTAAHCFPLAAYRARVDLVAQPSFAGSQCVSGILTYWMEDVMSVSEARKAGWFHGLYNHMLDLARFNSDRVYRDSITRVNVLTYVIRHGDSHTKNFVLARTAAGSVVVYSIDNSLSFTIEPNHGIPADHDWSKIKVPALPRVVIDRLRVASKRVDALARIAVLRPGGGRGAVVVGLSPAELDVVRARISELVTRADRGELTLY